jgi:hypothetical protein
MELVQQVNNLTEAKYDAPRGMLDTRLVVTPEHLRQARGNKFQVVVKMRPEDFLKLTSSDNHGPEYFQQHCKNVTDYNRWAEEGENIVMPGLWIKDDKVSSHEGRHRAAALICAGEKEMAVALKLDPTEEHQEKYGYWEAPYEMKWEDYPRALYGQYGKGIVMKSDMKPVVDGWNNLVKNLNEAHYAHDPHTVADQYNHFSREMNYGDIRHGDDTEMWVKDSGITGKTSWVMIYVEADNEEEAISHVKHYVNDFGVPYSNIRVPGRFGAPDHVEQATGFQGMWLVIVEYKQ